MFADDDSNILLPTNQGSGFANLNDKTKAAVARYQYDIGQQGTIGVTSTHRESSDYHNTVLSVDGSYGLISQIRLIIKSRMLIPTTRRF